jgi:transcriptional regulator with XRE-family HTH domain
MPLRWHLGHVVQNLMESNGIDTGGELATRAKVAPNTVSALLRGKTVDPDTLEKVANVFRMKRYELEKLLDDVNMARRPDPPPAPDPGDPFAGARTRGLSDDAIYVGLGFDKLTPNRQQVMINVLAALRNEEATSENGTKT